MVGGTSSSSSGQRWRTSSATLNEDHPPACLLAATLPLKAPPCRPDSSLGSAPRAPNFRPTATADRGSSGRSSTTVPAQPQPPRPSPVAWASRRVVPTKDQIKIPWSRLAPFMDSLFSDLADLENKVTKAFIDDDNHTSTSPAPLQPVLDGRQRMVRRHLFATPSSPGARTTSSHLRHQLGRGIGDCARELVQRTDSGACKSGRPRSGADAPTPGQQRDVELPLSMEFVDGLKCFYRKVAGALPIHFIGDSLTHI